MWILLGWILGSWMRENDLRWQQLLASQQQIIQNQQQMMRQPAQPYPWFAQERSAVVTHLRVHTPDGDAEYSEIKIIDRRAVALEP